jgi:hypothetical protein
MNQPHHPRMLIAILVLLVAVTCTAIALRTFTNAHAVALSTATPATFTPSSPADEMELVPSASAQTGTSEAGGETGSSSTPTRIRDPRDGDTTGIIAMAILLVTVLLVAMVAGERSTFKKERTKKKK